MTTYNGNLADLNKDDLLVLSLQLQPYERKQLAASLILSTLGEAAAHDVADNVDFGRDLINHKESI